MDITKHPSYRKIIGYVDKGKLDIARSLCDILCVDNPNHPDVLHMSGYIELLRGRPDDAIGDLTKAIGINSGNSYYYYHLGLAFGELGKYNQAIDCYLEAIEITPDLSCVYSDLCLAYKNLGKIKDALKSGHRAVELGPDNFAAYNNLAAAYDASRDLEHALIYYRKAFELSPDNATVHRNLGDTYTGLGNKKEAESSYRRAIALNPKAIEVYRHVTRFNKYARTDHPDICMLKSLLDQSWLTTDDRIDLYFALGKVHADCRLFDEAFDYYLSGNKLQDEKSNFSPDRHISFVTRLIDFYQEDLILDKSRYGNNSKLPVFIVGMPRSGTTLVEQIVSSHDDAFGAGELKWFSNLEGKISGILGTDEEYPTCLNKLDKSHIDILSNEYLYYLDSCMRRGDKIVSMATDKMPFNYIRLGLIKILFPNAKIIHCRRNPLDTCISIFTICFPKGMKFGTNLFNLGVYYSQYSRIMDHWQQVLSSGSILNIKYEDLVCHQEKETRKILKFLKLPWDDACLSFFDSNRAVFTASDLQVREPIYTKSIGRWENYRAHIGALKKGLAYTGSFKDYS